MGLRSFLIGLLACWCASGTPIGVVSAHDAQWTFTETTLGPLRVGMPIADALRSATQHGETVVREIEPMAPGRPRTLFVVRKAGERLFALEPVSAEIARIRIFSDAYRQQANGVGVGSTVVDLRRAYPRLAIAKNTQGAVAYPFPDPLTGRGPAFYFSEVAPGPSATVDHIILYAGD